MNTPYKIDKKALVVTARIQAALGIIPHIIGPKEDWGPWMCDGLQAEQGEILSASESSPHPRLLGSLKWMLVSHYRHGMTVDTLHFKDVHAEDPSIEGSGYIDIPGDGLPELKGANFGWQLLPPSVSLKATTPPIAVPLNSGSSEELEWGMSVQKPSRQLEPALDSAGNTEVTAASHETNTGTTGAAPHAKGKKHPPKDEDEGVRAKKKSKFKSIEFVDSEAEVDTQAGPSKDKGKRKAGTPVKLEGSEKGESSASRVREVCIHRGTECLWPPKTGGHKHACGACVAAKSCCKVEGIPGIHRIREKGATQKAASQEGTAGLQQCMATLQEALERMKKKQVAYKEENEVLQSMISEC